jgi:hypothetical protein
MPSMGAGHVLHLASRHDVPSRTQVWSQLPPPPFALRSFFRRRPCSRRHAAPAHVATTDARRFHRI